MMVVPQPGGLYRMQRGAVVCGADAMNGISFVEAICAINA